MLVCLLRIHMHTYENENFFVLVHVCKRVNIFIFYARLHLLYQDGVYASLPMLMICWSSLSIICW